MVDGQVRRTLRRSVSVADATSGQEHRAIVSLSGEPGTEPDIDRSTDADDRDVDQQPNGTVGVGVVEVSPERLGKFIEQRAAERGADSGSGDSSGNRTRKPRADTGTKRGKRGGKKEAQNIEPLVTMVHTWGAILLKTPELMLTADESKKLSDAYSQFCEHHDVPIMTEKRMSEINLIVAIATLYGPRLIAIKNRKRAEKGNGRVQQMPPVRSAVTH